MTLNDVERRKRYSCRKKFCGAHQKNLSEPIAYYQNVGR